MTNNVSLKDVYDITNEGFNRIEGKLDTLGARVSVLEMWKSQIVGQFVVILAVVNLAIAVSFDWIKKQIFGNRI